MVLKTNKIRKVRRGTRSSLKRGRPLKMTIKARKNAAWDIFSLWIRRSARQDDLGHIVCYTCGICKHWKEMQAGHGIEGRNNAVLFMEEVVKPQCKQCNIFKHGNLRVFTLKLVDELGRKKYNRLLRESEQVVPDLDYQEIYEQYKQKVDSLNKA